MVKMMVTVVVIYALCWLPLHSVTLAGDTNPAVWSYQHIQVVLNAKSSPTNLSQSVSLSVSL